MYRHSLRARWLGTLLGLSTIASISGLAHSGGFALIEHGASGLGNAYAGAAAVSADTSTVWFNPAGMSELDSREISGALHLLNSSTEFSNRGTTLGAALGSSAASGADTAEPGTTTVLPNFYYVAPINDQWRYGLSIGIPFGSSTDYEDDWVGRYTTIESGISVIDINPAISYKVSEKVRLGFGISLQRLTADLGSAVDSGAVCFGLSASTSITQTQCINNGLTPGNQPNDSFAEISGDSTAVGFNLGALFLPTENLKIGIAYRHSTEHELDGDADFQVNPILRAVLNGATGNDAQSQFVVSNILNDVGATAEVELPATLSFSGAWQSSDKLQWLSDLTWTSWSSFDELRVVFDNPAQSDSLSVQDWEDVLRFSVGLNYSHSNKLTLRAGFAFDEEAIPSPERRTARIPGNDRTWYSVGAGYAFSKNLSADVGFVHLALDETPINNSDPESEGTGQVVRGVFDSSVNILSAQLSWKFD